MNRRKRIELTKAGVILVEGSDERRIAAPIRFHAIGERMDRTKVVEIRFVNRDGEKLSEQFDMAAINPRNLAFIADALGNKGYLWPTDGISAVEILKVMVAKIPSRRFTFVGAPGWHGNAIVTPLRCYGGTKRIVIDPRSGAHLANLTKGPGTLKGWRKTVGRLAKQSTGLRLSIAAALAALLLRRLSMDSFALNLFAPTSTGKSSLLCAAASVPGLNNEDSGLPKWSESESAIEQLAIGHRDGLFPLDESGDQDGKVSPFRLPVSASKISVPDSNVRDRFDDWVGSWQFGPYQLHHPVFPNCGNGHRLRNAPFCRDSWRLFSTLRSLSTITALSGGFLAPGLCIENFRSRWQGFDLAK